MKHKIIIFKILTALLATGSAFASVSAKSQFAFTSAYVNYTTNNNSTFRTYCSKLADICNNTGAAFCTITINWIGQTAQISYSAKDNTCEITLVHTSTMPVGQKTIPKTNVTLLP